MSESNKKENALDQRLSKEEQFAENFVLAANESEDLIENVDVETNCPAPDDLVKLAELGKVLDESLLDHLFACRKCKGVFQTAYANFHVDRAESLQVPDDVRYSPRLNIAFLAGSFLIVVIAFSFIYFVMLDRSGLEISSIGNDSNDSLTNGIKTGEGNSLPENKIAKTDVPANGLQMNDSRNENQDTKPVSEKQGRSEVDTRDQPVSNKREKPATTRKRPISLVLTDDPILRNSDKLTDTTANLPSMNIDLDITLPKEFDNGNYEFSIVDSFGKKLYVAKNARITKGKLKLRGLPLDMIGSNGKRLCLQNANEIPRCFKIAIGNTTSH